MVPGLNEFNYRNKYLSILKQIFKSTEEGNSIDQGDTSL